MDLRERLRLIAKLSGHLPDDRYEEAKKRSKELNLRQTKKGSHLVVIADYEEHDEDGHPRRYVDVVCECGAEVRHLHRTKVYTNAITSCGCKEKEAKQRLQVSCATFAREVKKTLPLDFRYYRFSDRRGRKKGYLEVIDLFVYEYRPYDEWIPELRKLVPGTRYWRIQCACGREQFMKTKTWDNHPMRTCGNEVCQWCYKQKLSRRQATRHIRRHYGGSV